MSLYEVLDLLINFFTFIAVAFSVVYIVIPARYGIRKIKYDFFRDFYEHFLGPKILEERNSVASFWLQHQFLITHEVKDTNLKVPELAELQDPETIRKYLEQRTGVLFKDIDNAFVVANLKIIQQTEEVLNRYEHLAKLKDLKVISEKDIKLFFYTMLADTLVVCIPFILFRRKSKPIYAQKMQKLIRILPNLSLDWTRV